MNEPQPPWVVFPGEASYCWKQVRDALAKQGMADFRFMPGIGMEVAKWLSDTVQAGVVGGDTWATEVVPNPDAACAFCIHAHLLTRHGIVNQENMDLDPLSADKAWRFLYLYSPVPVAGATGSIGAPMAVR